VSTNHGESESPLGIFLSMTDVMRDIVLDAVVVCMIFSDKNFAKIEKPSHQSIPPKILQFYIYML
jgi:hypothetical protein